MKVITNKFILFKAMSIMLVLGCVLSFSIVPTKASAAGSMLRYFTEDTTVECYTHPGVYLSVYKGESVYYISNMSDNMSKLDLSTNCDEKDLGKCEGYSKIIRTKLSPNKPTN